MNLNAGPCILVFGVSGVGKSTACASFLKRRPEFLYAKASGLLAKATNLSAEELRKTQQSGILANQALLVEAFDMFRQNRWDQPVILDCHAVIDNDEYLVAIPTEIIRALDPTAMVLLEAEPESVSARREFDTRARPKRNVDQLEQETIAEREAVLSYSRELGVPALICKADTEFALDRPIDSLIGPADH